MKIGFNSPCPCGSRQKFKKCCKVFHNGVKAKTALELMKSRYSAFAVNDANYIIKTTHPKNSDFSEDIQKWKKSILSFSKNSLFKQLEILEFIEDKEVSFVTFHATIYQKDEELSFTEKSKFLKIQNQWLYHSGEFLDE